MRRFDAEFARLYGVHAPEDPTQRPLVTADGSVKALVLEIAKPADWANLSVVWYGTQSEWELPAAAIAVSGTEGLQLWFSVAEPVRAAHAMEFLSLLQHKYLSAVPAKRVRLFPICASGGHAEVVHANRVPAIQESGNWSAFVSADLASVFGEEPWLDIAPNLDQQADILSRLQPIKVSRFDEVLGLLRGTSIPVTPPAAPAANASHPTAAKMGARAFLTQVMNDPAVALKDRIEAAKALLPYER